MPATEATTGSDRAVAGDAPDTVDPTLPTVHRKLDEFTSWCDIVSP
jgi:hypothetical protein